MTRPGLTEESLAAALAEARACRLCARHLPQPPRPILRAAASARLLIVGQAPGKRAHVRGVPWDDPSGDRLRLWLGLDRARFYDARRVAIMPMGFCYPGTTPAGADLPPRPECAPAWHARLARHLRRVELTLLVGGYAQAFYLGARAKPTLTATVEAWREALPRYLPLPHPSWRNNAWLKRNPWFAEELLPELRRLVRRLVGE